MLQKQGVEARRAGRFAEAEARLREAARLKPDDADVQLQLGLTLTSLKKLKEAEGALGRALELAPDYADAKLGLARIAFFRGKFERARKTVLMVRSVRKDDKDVQDLLNQIDRALEGRRLERRARQRAEERRSITGQRARQGTENVNRWRIDADGSLSILTGERPNWREGNARIGFQVQPGTVVSTAVQAANRFGISDTYVEGRIDQKDFRGDLTGYLYAGATPNAHYLPEWVTGAGGTARVIQQKGLFAATVLTLDARYATYVAGPVRTVSPGMQQYFLDGRLWLTGRWINVVDEQGRYRQGYLVQSDVMLRNDLRVFMGYADAPETSLGVTVRTRSLFGGLVYDVSDALAVRLSSAYEQRPGLFNLRSYTAGVTYKF